MNDPLDQHFRELSWRQQLTKAEDAELQEFLAKHPEARANVEAESALTQLLEKVPPAPKVASNFTAQVMQAIEREKAVAARRPPSNPGVWRWVHTWLPRAAVAGLAALAGVIGVHQHHRHEQAVMAQRVEQVANAFSTLGREPVEHFEPIQRIAEEPPAADTDLSTLVASMK